MLAVIKSGGKQYIVEPGKRIKVEKLSQAEGENLSIEDVLLTIDGDKTKIGAPLVSGAKVTVKVLRHGRAKKITNLRYHSKTRYRKKKGHRQHFTELEIVSINE